MAEASQNTAPKSEGGKVRATKQAIKIDMTPMVDLAFLLLTFFILTTTFNKSRVMELTMPDHVEDGTRVPKLKDINAFNVVLAERNKIYWWIGLEGRPSLTDYSTNGIRKVLLREIQSNPDLMVLIKPMDKAHYGNMVDILDEVEIASITRYAIVEFTDDDARRVVGND